MPQSKHPTIKPPPQSSAGGIEPSRIDTFDLCRHARSLQGEAGAASLTRLASLLAHDDKHGLGALRWSLQGRLELAQPDDRYLAELAIQGRVYMPCVRCLEPVAVDLDGHTSVRFVGTEEEAEQEDLDDEAFDVLAGGPRFDLADFVEDEAILALPSLPRHERCPGASDRTGQGSAVVNAREPEAGDESAEAPAEERQRPFADLAERMRRRH